MADGSRVKGVAFRSVFASLGKLRGKPAQQAALSRLGEELQNAFNYGGIVPGGWYPIDWYKELFSAIRSATAAKSWCSRLAGSARATTWPAFTACSPS